MTNHVLINNVEHNDVRVVTTRSAKYGDAIMSCITFPTGVSLGAGVVPHLVAEFS